MMLSTSAAYTTGAWFVGSCAGCSLAAIHPELTLSTSNVVRGRLSRAAMTGLARLYVGYREQPATSSAGEMRAGRANPALLRLRGGAQFTRPRALLGDSQIAPHRVGADHIRIGIARFP